MYLGIFISKDEIDAVVSQNVIPSKMYLGGAAPFTYREECVLTKP